MSSTSTVPEVDGTVQITQNANGSKYAILKNAKGCSVEINFDGAQVTSWKLESGQELLFTSSCKTDLEHAKPAHRGINISFPHSASPAHIEEHHGFARNMVWTVDSDPNPPNTTTVTAGVASLDLILFAPESFNNSCEFRLRVVLGETGDLTLLSRISNTNADGRSFQFSFAYQNYIRVCDVTDVRIEGLETLDYLDNLRDEERNTEQDDAVIFESEVDRLYLSTPPKLAIIDHGSRFTIVLRKDAGLPDAIVWNPWEKIVKPLPDLSASDFNHLVVVGSGAVEKPVTLKPGEEWTAKQILSFSPTSYNSDDPDSSLL